MFKYKFLIYSNNFLFSSDFIAADRMARGSKAQQSNGNCAGNAKNTCK